MPCFAATQTLQSQCSHAGSVSSYRSQRHSPTPIFNKTCISKQVLSLQVANSLHTQDKSGAGYPDEEVEWLIATAWNMAVDAKQVGDAQGCCWWAGIANEIAGGERGGSVGKLVRDSYTGLVNSV